MNGLNILTLGTRNIYQKHLLFHNIVSDFRDKLPRPQNSARELSQNEKDKHPLMKNSTLSHSTVLDLSTHQSTVTERDLDEFYNRLNNFDLEFMFSQNHYRSFVKNLIRLKPKAENKNMDLVILQKALEMTDTKPSKVLFYHLKYKWKMSSWIYDKFSRH